MVCARQDHGPSDACMDCAREKYSDLLQSHHSLCGKVAQLDHDKEVLIGQRDQAYAEKDAALLQINTMTDNALVACQAAYKKGLEEAGLQVDELQKELAYSKEVEITGDRLLEESNRLNGELKDALRALVVKVHGVNKGTEYLFVFAANHAMGQYAGPQYGEELIRAGKLVDLGKTEKRVDLAPERPFTAEELQKLKDSPFKGPPA